MNSATLFAANTSRIDEPRIAQIAATSSESFMVQKEESAPKTGSVYVNPAKKNEVLFKTSIWGAVQYPGVHYLPLGTKLLDALGSAGGPIERADMDKLILSSHGTKGLVVKNLSVSEALADDAKNPILQPDDVLVVKEDHSNEKLGLYLQAGAFVVSLIAVGLLIGQKH